MAMSKIEEIVLQPSTHLCEFCNLTFNTSQLLSEHKCAKGGDKNNSDVQPETTKQREVKTFSGVLYSVEVQERVIGEADDGKYVTIKVKTFTCLVCPHDDSDDNLVSTKFPSFFKLKKHIKSEHVSVSISPCETVEVNKDSNDTSTTDDRPHDSLHEKDPLSLELHHHKLQRIEKEKKKKSKNLTWEDETVQYDKAITKCLSDFNNATLKRKSKASHYSNRGSQIKTESVYEDTEIVDDELENTDPSSFPHFEDGVEDTKHEINELNEDDVCLYSSALDDVSFTDLHDDSFVSDDLIQPSQPFNTTSESHTSSPTVENEILNSSSDLVTANQAFISECCLSEDDVQANLTSRRRRTPRLRRRKRNNLKSKSSEKTNGNRPDKDASTDDVKQQSAATPDSQRRNRFPTISCPTCDFVTTSKVKLLQHGKEIHHTKIRMYTCTVCEFSFQRERELREHVRCVHDDKCGGVGSSKTTICPVCGLGFSRKGNLDQHYRAVHLKIKDYKCPECEYTGSRVSDIKSHLKHIHSPPTTEVKTIINKYFCEQCNDAFPSNRDLQKHVKFIHQNVRCYICIHCDKYFSHKDNLSVHIKTIHENQKSHSCIHCSMTFSQSQNLKAHVKAIHEKIKDQTCPVCFRAFTRRTDLRGHMRKIHGPPGSGAYTDEQYYGPSHTKVKSSNREHQRLNLIYNAPPPHILTDADGMVEGGGVVTSKVDNERVDHLLQQKAVCVVVSLCE